MPCTLRWMAPRSSTAASSAKHSEARCWSGHARSCLLTWWVGRGFGTLQGSLLMAQSVWCHFGTLQGSLLMAQSVWCHFGTLQGSLLMAQSVWCHFGTLQGSLLMAQSVWCHFGTLQGSLLMAQSVWCHFGILQGSLLMAQSVWYHFWSIVILHWAIPAPHLYYECHRSRQDFKDATVLCHGQTGPCSQWWYISKLNHRNQIQLN